MLFILAMLSPGNFCFPIYKPIYKSMKRPTASSVPEASPCRAEDTLAQFHRTGVCCHKCIKQNSSDNLIAHLL